MSPETVGFAFGLALGCAGWLIRDLIGLFTDDRRTETYAADLDQMEPRSTEPLDDRMDPVVLEALVVPRQIPGQKVDNGEDLLGWDGPR